MSNWYNYYQALSDAIVETMNADERALWDRRVQVINEDTHLELLVTYVQHKQHLPALDGSSAALHDVVKSYEGAGFTRAEAMQLLVATIRR